MEQEGSGWKIARKLISVPLRLLGSREHVIKMKKIDFHHELYKLEQRMKKNQNCKTAEFNIRMTKTLAIKRQ